MKLIRLTMAALATAGAAAAVPASAAVDVGVSIGISQPGVYGRVDIGRFPQPQLVVQQPVVVYGAPPVAQPVYMWVPPGHRKHWRQRCAEYRACGAPVYFVQDRWYHDRVYAGPGHDRGYERDRDWDRDRGHAHGR